MKSLGKPRYTQQQYDQASAIYMEYRYDQAVQEGRPRPAHQARLPLFRPSYGRMGAGVCKAISMHLGISVAWIRLLFLVAATWFGAGVIAYVFLWMTVPIGDPVQHAYALAANRPLAQSPLAKGNRPYETHTDPADRTASARTRQHAAQPYPQSYSQPYPQPQAASRPDATPTDFDNAQGTSESLEQTLRRTPKPVLLTLAGLAFLSLCLILLTGGVEPFLIIPLLLGLTGIGVSWLRFNAEDGQLWTMLGGIAIIFAAYAMYTGSHVRTQSVSMPGILLSGLALLVGVLLAIVPWIMALIRDLGMERALKEREEERADMTAHLHDGVLQTLALIQLHADDQQTVFSLARSQERELREWLYQERTTSDRSVNAGLKEIAAMVEDTHGKPIEVVTVGDARPSAQTDALLEATQQALINAVTHGGEPVSVYCEANDTLVEVFVRDHGDGFDVHAVPANRLGIRESIIGRIERRGGTVEIVSRPQWGTEVRMHMPIAAAPARTQPAAGDAAQQQQQQQPQQPQRSQYQAATRGAQRQRASRQTYGDRASGRSKEQQ
ncbi:PspC domain-containing protein [Bifidobacterium sp. 64T4]|uniref:ATP-binding protein n=1 Tax=Bifidobacterium pongonis TaxID=2834432 RepID=UPI001C57EA18|nr:ATP-binding protein [Bifidobacterium pongonis]MBW3094950.1 PspC domain-containing protein [Bifidobacterium pongonis]